MIAGSGAHLGVCAGCPSSRAFTSRTISTVGEKNEARNFRLKRSCFKSDAYSNSLEAFKETGHDRLQWLAPVAAAVIITSSGLGAGIARAEYATPQSGYAYTDSDEVALEEARYDENLMTPELKELVAVLERRGDSVKEDEVQALRKKVGFQRSASGRVFIRARTGEWFNVKADMQTPGYLLMRSLETNNLWALPADASGRLLQIDLSDDMVVGQLFNSGAWFDVMQPLKVDTKSNGRVPLKMSAGEFMGVASLLSDAEEQ